MGHEYPENRGSKDVFGNAQVLVSDVDLNQQSSCPIVTRIALPKCDGSRPIRRCPPAFKKHTRQVDVELAAFSEDGSSSEQTQGLIDVADVRSGRTGV